MIASQPAIFSPQYKSNESLQTYAIKAPITGLIVRRDIQTGEATGNNPLFTIADLSQVWAELDVFGRNLNHVQQGQSVVVETLNGKSGQWGDQLDLPASCTRQPEW